MAKIIYQKLETNGTTRSGMVSPRARKQGWKFDVGDARQYMIDVWSNGFLRLELSQPNDPKEVLATASAYFGGPDLTLKLEPATYYISIILGEGANAVASYDITIKKPAG